MKRDTFLHLAQIHEPHCISIYLPKENADKDNIRLKNHIQQAEQILQNTYGLDNREVKAITDRIWKVAGTFTYHSQPGTGMVIFSYGDQAEKLDLNKANVPDKLYIADHLYVVPLAEAVDKQASMLLLQLSAQQAKLWVLEDGKAHIHPASERLPEQIRDVVGHDVTQKALQFRQGQQGSGGGEQSGMYHGQGAGSDSEQKEEYRKYFRAIDKVIQEEEGQSGLPLIIAAVDYLIPMYKEVSHYQHWHDEHLEGNFDDASAHTLGEACKPLMAGSSNDIPTNDKFQQWLSKGGASYQEPEIVKAAVEGKVDTLLVRRNEDVFGKYDMERAKAELEHFKTVDNTSLVNLAVIETIKQGGEVILAPKEAIPVSNHVMNAVFRYENE